jgi:hypothetical protein
MPAAASRSSSSARAVAVSAILETPLRTSSLKAAALNAPFNTLKSAYSPLVAF